MVKRNVDILIRGKDNASGSFNKARSSADRFYGSIKSLAAFGGVSLGLGVITRELGEFVKMGDDIGKASKRIGVAAEEYQKLTFAARRSGASNDDIEKSIKRLSSTIFDLEAGLSEPKRAFDALGLSLDDVKGKSPEEQFKIIADRLNLVADASTKAALAQDIFGRAGTKLIPMIGEYRELAEEATNLGLISNESVKAAEDLSDAWENLKQTFIGIVSDSGILTWLRDFADGVKAIRDIENLPTGISGVLREYARSIAGAYAEGLKGTLNFLGADIQTTTKEIEQNLDRIFGKSFVDAPIKTASATKDEVDAARERKALADKVSGAREMAKLRADEEKARQKRLDEEMKFQELSRRRFEIAKGAGRNLVADLKQEVEIQKLLNAGKEKQAAIQSAVNAAQKAGVLSEDIDAIARLQAQLFDLRKKEDKATALDEPQRALSGTVSRFLSFRQQGAQTTKIAEENKNNTKKTAQNTAEMKTILVDIAEKIGNNNGLELLAAGFR